MSDEVKQIFARRIRHYTELSELNQQEVANRLGLSTSTVNDWYTGKKMPRMDKVQALADLFDVDISDLVDENEPLVSADHRYLLDRMSSATPEQLEQLRKLAEIILSEDAD